jgi:hypothetical protein
MLSAAVCLAAGAGAALAALDGWELSSHDVRNAYFLGQRRADQQLYQFLASYQQRLAATSQGPQVWSVEISTPYHQVVQRSLRSPNYSAQQAQRDYDRLGDRIVVTAQVSLPLARVYTFGDSRIWDAFDLHLVQDGRRIVPGQLRREPVYSFGENSTLTGFLLRAEFSVRQVARGPVRVEVVTDQNDAVGTQFDLARLR